jgi:hypothetical protein
MAGVNSLGISHTPYMDLNANEDDEDDASDIEDVQIQPGDALIVVAKTEEVGLEVAAGKLVCWLTNLTFYRFRTLPHWK